MSTCNFHDSRNIPEDPRIQNTENFSPDQSSEGRHDQLASPDKYKQKLELENLLKDKNERIGMLNTMIRKEEQRYLRQLKNLARGKPETAEQKTLYLIEELQIMSVCADRIKKSPLYAASLDEISKQNLGSSLDLWLLSESSLNFSLDFTIFNENLDFSDKDSKEKFKGATNWILSVSFSQNFELVASGGKDSMINLWDFHLGSHIQSLSGHSGHVTSLAFSPDGSELVSGSSDSLIFLWEIPSGQILKKFTFHENTVLSVKFSCCGRYIVSGGTDHTVCVSNRKELLHTLRGHTEDIKDTAFSPCGKYVLSASRDFTLKLWDFKNENIVHELNSHTNYVISTDFSPCGRFIASCSWDKSIKIWQCNGVLSKTMLGHTDHVLTVAFSPSGMLLASGSRDRTVRIWDLQDGECEQIIQGHCGLVRWVVFCKDDKKIVSGSFDSSVKLWKVNKLREIW